MTQQASGVLSPQTVALRTEIDNGWSMIRAGLPASDRVASLEAEISKMQSKAEALEDEVGDLRKRLDETESELELTAERIQTFQGMLAEAKELRDGPKAAAPVADPAAAAQLAQVTATLSGLIQALSAQAPGLLAALPPGVLAGLQPPSQTLPAPAPMEAGTFGGAWQAQPPLQAALEQPPTQTLQAPTIQAALAGTPTPARAPTVGSHLPIRSSGLVSRAGGVGGPVINTVKAGLKSEAQRKHCRGHSVKRSWADEGQATGMDDDDGEEDTQLGEALHAVLGETQQQAQNPQQALALIQATVQAHQQAQQAQQHQASDQTQQQQAQQHLHLAQQQAHASAAAEAQQQQQQALIYQQQQAAAMAQLQQQQQQTQAAAILEAQQAAAAAQQQQQQQQQAQAAAILEAQQAQAAAAAAATQAIAPAHP